MILIAEAFVLCMYTNITTGLKNTINDEGVWRIRRSPHSGVIEVFKVEEVGHGSILTDEFINWRIKLSLNSASN